MRKTRETTRKPSLAPSTWRARHVDVACTPRRRGVHVACSAMNSDIQRHAATLNCAKPV